ncbi:hypothetical protein CL630_00030 [bacterium]|nr:hypothetical protein [bacterium]|tara:strand:- start:290 stop:559 length:270 start_codon:yes stop_codon:yes gene_type:complete
MNTITVNKTEETDSGWAFDVSVDNNMHNVSLDKKYLKKISSDVSPEELVKRSFQFLLEREPPEAILKEFNIKIISAYFPEYESVISGKK